MHDSVNEDRARPSAPADRLGQLCQEGRDVAAYLHQVPDDEAQRRRLGEILEEISQDRQVKARREFPRIVEEIKEALDNSHPMAAAEVAQVGFDRMMRLWQTARSGLSLAIPMPEIPPGAA